MKRRRLAEAVQQRQQQIDRLDRQIRQIDEEQAGVRERIQAVRDARQVADFAAIDFRTDENEIAALQMEKKALEDNNDTIRLLKRRLAEREQQIAVLETSRKQVIQQEGGLDRWIADANRLIANNRRLLVASQSDGSFARHAECFPELDAAFVDQPLSIENWRDRQETFSKSRREERERLRLEIRPVEDAVRKAMIRYLQDNPDDKIEFEADLRYLDDFLGLLERIRVEDLPKYEKRFKERLNEKVGEEVGVLRGDFHTERIVIEERIQLLNESLQKVEYRSGTHMRLKVQQVRDREIAEFRQALDECVSSQFDGTPEANEARYLRIEKLITRLREEGPWRLKVTDVRNWFDFAAVETVDETGEERSYHEDSTGQSGGEKAKLAFTILVAAIAYQYDLDPHRPVSDRFHFVVVDEMFSRIDDSYSKYALDLFQKFGLQLLIVAPLDAKARVTEPYVGCYLHVAKHPETSCCEVHWMTAREFQESMALTTEVA